MAAESSRLQAAKQRWIPNASDGAKSEACTVKCSRDNKKNKCDQDTSKLLLSYGDFGVPGHLKLPRKYTSIHNDETAEIFIFVGHEYNQEYLNSEEAKVVQSQVVGKWVKSRCGYKIKFQVLVSTPQNPYPFFRNLVFCQELGHVLQGVALIEGTLLARHPELKDTPIEIHFISQVDPAYDRVEEWGTLGHWICGKCK